MFTKNEWIVLHLVQQSMSAEARIFLVLDWAQYVKTHSDKNWSKIQNIIIHHELINMPQLSVEAYLRKKGEIYFKRRLNRHS